MVPGDLAAAGALRQPPATGSPQTRPPLRDRDLVPCVSRLEALRRCSTSIKLRF